MTKLMSNLFHAPLLNRIGISTGSSSLDWGGGNGWKSSLSLSFPPSTYDGFEFHLFLFLFFSSSLLVSTIFFVTFDWISMSLDGMDRRTDLSLVFRDEKPCGSQIRNDWAPPIVCIGGIGRRAPRWIKSKDMEPMGPGFAQRLREIVSSWSALAVIVVYSGFINEKARREGGCKEWIFGWK